MSNPRSILITGASSGFGLGAAKALAARGHTVYATMRGVSGKNAEAARALTAWAKDGGHQVTVVELDVTDEASVNAAVAQIVADGAIDTLINNAGVGTWGFQEGFTPDQVLRMLDVNVVGPLRLNRAVLPHMRARGGGHVIYISSGLGRIQLPFLAPYTASKHAVEGMAGASRYELLAEGVHTSILQPGAYGTTFLENSVLPAEPERLEGQPHLAAMAKGFTEAFEARAKAGQLGDPQEVVDALVELVEAGPGVAPVRRTVGKDVQQGVGAINAAAAAVQGYLEQAYGLA